MKRTTWPGARLVGAVLLVALLVAAVTVPAAVWPDSYPPALAAGLAVSVAVAAVGLLAIVLRRRTRERLLAAAELEALRAAMPVAVVAVDLDGAVLHWNAGAEALYDYDAEEMRGRPFSVLAGEDGDGVIEAVREGKHFADSEAVHRRKDGTEISVSVTVAPICGATGETAGAVLTATDVSEPRRALARLAEVEAKYRSLIDCLPLVTYAHPVGERASLLHVSPQVRALLGYAPDEWLAQPELFSGLLHPDDRERVSR